MVIRIIRFFLFASIICIGHVPLFAAEPAAADVEFFEQRIRQVLAEHCYSCHSADAKQQKTLKGGLLLDTRDVSRSGGETGPAVVPTDVGRSLLVAALRHQGSLEMPPTGKLPDTVILPGLQAGDAEQPRPNAPSGERNLRISTRDLRGFG